MGENLRDVEIPRTMNPDLIEIHGTGKYIKEIYAKLKILPRELFYKKRIFKTLEEVELEARCVNEAVHIRPRKGIEEVNEIVVPNESTAIRVYCDGSVYFCYQGNKYHAYPRQ